MLIRRRVSWRFLVAALGALLDVDDALLEAFEVGQHQLGLDDLEIRDRVDTVLDVGDVVVDEAAGDEGHGVAVADIGQELVAQALALGRAAHQAGDVDEGDARGMISLEPAISARASRRGSGTATSPVFGSIVQNG
jgi:hypothetical protein